MSLAQCFINFVIYVQIFRIYISKEATIQEEELVAYPCIVGEILLGSQ